MDGGVNRGGCQTVVVTLIFEVLFCAFLLLPFSNFETGCDEKRVSLSVKLLAHWLTTTTLAMANIKDNPP